MPRRKIRRAAKMSPERTNQLLDELNDAAAGSRALKTRIETAERHGQDRDNERATLGTRKQR